VRSIWLRHDLANFKTRLKALVAKVAEDGDILTEAQALALEKKKHDDEACGERECHELCVSGPVPAGFRYSHALKRSLNVLAN